MLSLARFEPSCSVYGRECLLEFFRQRVGNDTDLGDLAGQARPAGADGDARPPGGDRGARAETTLQRTDACRRFRSLARRTHHRAGADQDFADNTIDHRSKLGIVMERGQLLQGAVGFL